MAILTERDLHDVVETESGSGNIAYLTTAAISQASPKFKSFRLHLSEAGGATNLTLKFDSHLGAAYDTVLDIEDMTAVTDYEYIPPQDGLLKLYPGDKISVTWTNANQATYGYTATYIIE